MIAHRGASAHRPEHTLASYLLAMALGADYVEPDLVVTGDGVLVCRHEPELSSTTDVVERTEFADRYRAKVVDGELVSGWFVEDFSLAELRTLRARERYADLRPANTAYDGQLAVPTLQEVIDLVGRGSRVVGRPIGIYPEPKMPGYFAAIGLPMEERLADILERNRLDTADAKVFVQCFDSATLRTLAELLRVPLVQLIGLDAPSYDLGDIAHYADAIGVDKRLVLPPSDVGLGRPTSLVDDAHAHGLALHVWTLRPENAFLPRSLRVGRLPRQHGDTIQEHQSYLSAGVDGIFTDSPDIARIAVAAHRHGMSMNGRLPVARPMP